MTTYAAPTDDTWFVVKHVLQIDRYSHLEGYDALDEGFFKAILDGVGRFASEVLAPLNQTGDMNGCTRNENGSVTTPPGFKAAYRQWLDAGWAALEGAAEFGGMGLPKIVSTAASEYVLSANQAFETYSGLTNAATAALAASASDELKALYLPRMTTGQWSGTMNLTEPHCGTDLGLLRTKATPNADGTFAISGTKIFITAGEHDLTENIVHLVLARLPDAPAGVRGISLFLVPKFIPDSDGAPGAQNSVSCGSIEHKMGIRGSATCTMNYDGATGWLVGEPHRGLSAMFVMMNSARLGVGQQGLAQAEAAFQNAKAYALDRRQGRALTGPSEPDKPADLLIVHPDVRRVLMEAKVYTEGLRALCLWGGLLVDVAEHSPDATERAEAEDRLALLTPVIKAFGSDKGFETAVNCQQIWGGHGYISENGVDQFVRDARIAMIYEGANAVQAMDLVGRKLGLRGGKTFECFVEDVEGLISNTSSRPELAKISTSLDRAASDVKAAAIWLQRRGAAEPDDLGAGATAFLHMFGVVTLGFMWLRMAEAALSDGAASDQRSGFLTTKLLAAQFYASRILPETASLRAKVEAGSEIMMAMSPCDF
ncbi:acyl-CoA dehydrogenase C-terminal domain-containing protein [Novosphingobium sp. MMS21-SN21R]|uniref:acyl-CoA dehydrogenase C-terminal domain-containing protein n=1 Tax=Novosphingobium sp. MMS21-SN21R TaxID=2969298 RepID=UPI002887BB3B|nr:acyl-CoA dehydrogenase C-terminal domain-containing protein [Novosphingobium sp. MMS21-SN21R]MDT0507028.1 acyl-CoA dehydrogenase C-terminal domain-containing protein [Novosphingobium sp. MMS21-SN21R]